MDTLTSETVEKLRSVGFCYPDREHLLNTGMVYFYEGETYVIGGGDSQDFTEQDCLVAREGCWLPDLSHLLNWLSATDFSYTLHHDSTQGLFHLTAHDTITGTDFCHSGSDLLNSLAKVIFKICRSKERPYIPSPEFSLEIL